MFAPSRKTQIVTINIHVESDTVVQPWGEENVERITSIKHDATELLDSNTLPIHYGAFGKMSFETLSSIISNVFCIPSSRLKIITNKPECKDRIYFSDGLKKLQELH